MSARGGAAIPPAPGRAAYLFARSRIGGRSHYTATGRRATFDRDHADARIRVDPTKCSLVSPSQYRTTD